ncbi:MAG: inositol monophosphatase family protein [Acidimicrobiales bacterium]
MGDDELLEVLRDAAGAVGQALAALDDWGLAGTRAGQYRSDLAADRAAVDVLTRAGLAVLSEESGLTEPARRAVGAGGRLVVVVDPVDGSTNASRHLPWYATSLCAVDEDGPRVAVVVNQALGVRYEAVRGAGAARDGSPIRPSGCDTLGQAIVGMSGYPRRYLGWSQYRSLGAAALDLCAVADGALDAYVVVGGSALGSWDYLGGMLVCTEAGASVSELSGRALVTLEHGERRTPVAAATPELLGELAAAVVGAEPAAP